MREYQVRICERLGVKFPGPTRHLKPEGFRAACTTYRLPDDLLAAEFCIDCYRSRGLLYRKSPVNYASDLHLRPPVMPPQHLRPIEETVRARLYTWRPCEPFPIRALRRFCCRRTLAIPIWSRLMIITSNMNVPAVLTIFRSAAGKFGPADIEARVEELASLPADWA